IATVFGLCPFRPFLLGFQGGGIWCTALITALVKSAVKLRFTWFATFGFILFFAHPIQGKDECFLLNYLFRDEAPKKM
ncbi:MAG: hypothetical protein MUO82_01780, partial [Candidatus Thermoplasmatota archaeon]|nr:hypothetical protein [Candidatus Thermoplasmatota archaeon]